MTRRHFLGQSAVAAALAAEAGQAAALPIVDTHQHLWDLDRLRLPWLAGAGPLNRSYVLKDYLDATAGLNIVRSVYMEVDVDRTREEQEKEADYITSLCRARRRVPCAAVIGGDPSAGHFRDYLSRFRGSPYVKGVRHIPHAAAGRPHPYQDSHFVEGVRLLGEMGMCFDICCDPQALPLALGLVAACPDTRFVLDHCGNADPKWLVPGAVTPEGDAWKRGVDALAARKNAICKISGIVARATKDAWSPADLAPAINHCLDAFGPDRVVFGSDWPVCTTVATPVQWVKALKEIIAGRPAEHQRKLLHDNAMRFYGLK